MLQHTRSQIDCIKRYHRHLLRCGAACSLEQAARRWITRFAACWRRHQRG